MWFQLRKSSPIFGAKAFFFRNSRRAKSVRLASAQMILSWILCPTVFIFINHFTLECPACRFVPHFPSPGLNHCHKGLRQSILSCRDVVLFNCSDNEVFRVRLKAMKRPVPTHGLPLLLEKGICRFADKFAMFDSNFAENFPEIGIGYYFFCYKINVVSIYS